MIYLLKSLRIYLKYIITIIFIICLVLGIYIYNQTNKDEDGDEQVILTDAPLTMVTDNIVDTVFVDIKGAVKNPGVYELKKGSRVIDAIKMSGNLTKDADTSVINLSKVLEDGNVIIIYTKDKIKEIEKSNTVIEYIEKECNCPDTTNNSCISQTELILEKPVEQNSNSDYNNSKISLNTATKEELMTLYGIGESKAIDIIEYRKNNNGFKDIEDIKSIKGIGDALFNKIKESITI